MYAFFIEGGKMFLIKIDTYAMSQTFCSHIEDSSQCHTSLPKYDFSAYLSTSSLLTWLFMHTCTCVRVFVRVWWTEMHTHTVYQKKTHRGKIAGHMLQSAACLASDGAANAFKNGFGLARIDSQCHLLYTEEMENALLWNLPSSMQLLSDTTRAV